MTSARMTFLGTGEAFDAEHGNTSIYIRTASRSYLFDCGFTAPFHLWRLNADPNLIDVVYLSHFHADHSFGLPALLARMNEDGRSKPLPVLGQRGVGAFVERLVNMAYAGLMKNLGFKLEPIEVSSTKETHVGSHRLSFHATRHAVTNLGMRLAFKDFSLFMSGDGEITADTRAAITGSSYVVQECYTVDDHRRFHSSFKEVEAALDGAETPKRVFLCHTARHQREALFHRIKTAGREYLIPTALQTYELD